ncbi:MAG: NdvB protein [Pseudomonadota bacterium]
MPLASGYLWNKQMMLQINCQGYANAQFMQPEPASYAGAPVLQATTFMQPEQPVYAHHPGRFFYIKDEETGSLSSIPFAPVKKNHDSFTFIVEDQTIRWDITQDDLVMSLQVRLDEEKAVEHWTLAISNRSNQVKKLSIYPYFPLGYRSWMNQSADYDQGLQAIVCHRVSPYQKIDDYYAQRDFLELSFLMAEAEPDSWEARQSQFEGELGLHAPAGTQSALLQRGDALYETPCAAMQFRRRIARGQETSLRFSFGAAQTMGQLKQWSKTFFPDASTTKRPDFRYTSAISKLSTPDTAFNDFVNLWLPRQIQYHNDLHRLSTDPQTRNFLQDSMGLVFLDANRARQNLLLALSQQNPDGSMPDGILLHPQAQLKYINKVPHSDHGVWLVIAIHCYLRETNDFEILDEQVVSHYEPATSQTVFSRVSATIDCLASSRDHRGLSFINQGDWCDPMNMVGHQGHGVSIWLTMATAYAAKLWAEICSRHGNNELEKKYLDLTMHCNSAVNKHAWAGKWYARGISDEGRTFGIEADTEGKIFLNPQSWAMLSGAADVDQRTRMMRSVNNHLNTPWGLEMLSPAFTTMHEDIGRVTQKFPGTAENGSIYNHAAAFYVYAMYLHDKGETAFDGLRKMLPADEDDHLRRGQLANFVPNYYRGASQQHPRTAGRSSQLFHTGTVHWYLRCVIDGTFGLRGHFDRLLIQPQLPHAWEQASVERQFRGARFDVSYQRGNVGEIAISLDGSKLESPFIENIKAGKRYRVEVTLPILEEAAHG